MFGQVLAANDTRIDQTLACKGSDYQSSTPWIPPLDREQNSCGGCLAPHEASSSYKSRSSITRHAPPSEHVYGCDRPPKPREEAPAGRSAGVAAAAAVSLRPNNRRRRVRRRVRGGPDPRHGEGDRPRTRPSSHADLDYS